MIHRISEPGRHIHFHLARYWYSPLISGIGSGKYKVQEFRNLCACERAIAKLVIMPSYPFQKLCCVQPVNNQQPFLVAASGPLIISFGLNDGSVLGRWPNQDSTTQDESSEGATGNGNRASKRRKLDTEDTTRLSRQSSEDSIEIISERKKGERRKPKVESTQQPNISHLLATSDGTTVIAVMAEDKSVNVFEVKSESTLKLQSKRFVLSAYLGYTWLTPELQMYAQANVCSGLNT